MDLADRSAQMSKDPSTQVGVVLVKDRKVVGTGFNGFPCGIRDDARLHTRKKKYALMIHAEMNALLDAGSDAAGSTLYSPVRPCVRCAVHLIQAGVFQVVTFGRIPNGHGQDTMDSWLEDMDEAEEICKEVGLHYLYLNEPGPS